MEELFKVNRREFLKKISMVTGSAAALAAMPWLNVFNRDVLGKSANDTVRLGFIGIGDRGRALLLNVKAFMELANVEIAAVCDNYEPNLRRAIKLTDGKAKGYADHRRMLDTEKLDGVVVATPVHEHAHITIDALNSGMHVFCEKVMARTIDQTKNMFDAHTQNKRILQIGHQRLFHPVYLNSIQKIRRGEIGQVTHMRAYWHRNHNWRRPVPEDKPWLEKKINWRLYTEFSGGLFTELLCHQVQVMNWIKQAVPVSVVANGSNIYWLDGRTVDDHISCLMIYPDGSQFVYDSINSNKHYGCEEQIMGSKGAMELEINKFYSENPPKPPAILKLINDIEKDIFETIPIGGASWIPETAVKYKGEFISDNYKMDESKLQLEAFVRYIRDGNAPEELTREGYYAAVWSLLAEQAAKTGERTTLPQQYLV